MSDEHGKHKFTVVVDGESFNLADHEVEGREILEKSHHNPASEFVLIVIEDRSTRSIGLNEKVDLRDYESPTFITFEGGEIRQFTVDERGYEWGSDTISTADIRSYAQIADDYELFLDKARDEPIDDNGSLSLSPKGVEHVVSRKRKPKSVTIIVNTRPKEVFGTQITFEEVVRLAYESLPTGGDIEFTVQYRRGPEPSVEGSMNSGSGVKIKERMVFVVSFTDKS